MRALIAELRLKFIGFQTKVKNLIIHLGLTYLVTSRAVQLTVFQLIINGNKFVTFNRTNRLITAVISDRLHSLPFLHLILTFRL